MRLDPTKSSDGTITFTEAKNGDLSVYYNLHMWNKFGGGGQYLDAPISTVTPRIGGGPPVAVVPEPPTWAMMCWWASPVSALPFTARRPAQSGSARSEQTSEVQLRKTPRSGAAASNGR
jgi:hypothetical protein